MPYRSLRITALVLPLVVVIGADSVGVARGTAAATIAVAKSAVDSTRLRNECEYGIALALAGSDASAESAFVSLLSHAPGDARALNNLGNIRLLRGDFDVALAYYARAGEVDSVDPGILLNEATALMLRGDDDEAETRAAEGVRRAGGVRQAALLLGLKAPESGRDAPKAGNRAYIRKDEVLALLRAAAAGVPVDTTQAKPDSTQAKSGNSGARVRKGKRTVTLRSAGARGAEGTDISAVVYWKQ